MFRRYYTDIYWIRENLRPNKPLSVDHALPSFIMLGLGIIPAAIIFFVEVFHSKFKKMRGITGIDSGSSQPQENASVNPQSPNIESQKSGGPKAKGKAYEKIVMIAGPSKEIPERVASNGSFDKVVEDRDTSIIYTEPYQPPDNDFDNRDDPDIEAQPY